MIASDADIISDVLRDRREYVERVARIPRERQAVPIVVVEEVMRGRLAAIRQAESGKGRPSLTRAYTLFEKTFSNFRHLRLLAYTERAESLYEEWRPDFRPIGTHDLRIAAVCVAHDATLVTRNRRDFERIPGLKVEFWA